MNEDAQVQENLPDVATADPKIAATVSKSRVEISWQRASICLVALATLVVGLLKVSDLGIQAALITGVLGLCMTFVSGNTVQKAAGK